MQASDAARNYYARLISGVAGVQDPRVTAAFKATPRERFVGAGPWSVFAFNGYIETPTDDPAYLYQDVLVALSSAQGINNGSPSLHARCLDALGLRGGETAVHIGAGSGYYTALLASLVGATGTVRAYEIDADLIKVASANLADLKNVTLEGVSGTAGALPTCDAIYVNAGATHPLESWLDALRPDGRLLFPLTPDRGLGGMLLVTRDAARSYKARFVTTAAFIPCSGAREPEMAGRVAAAFGRGSMWSVRSLHRRTTPDASCWLAGNGWWLSTA
jgi:protein-L-isoaspartate(D-aspartate) O-methyltransferase